MFQTNESLSFSVLPVLPVFTFIIVYISISVLSLSKSTFAFTPLFNYAVAAMGPARTGEYMALIEYEAY